MRVIKVTSVFGHLYKRIFTENNFVGENVTPYPDLFNAKTGTTENNPNLKIIQHIQKEASNCNNLVLWFDNDREGENMCFQVLSAVK